MDHRMFDDFCEWVEWGWPAYPWPDGKSAGGFAYWLMNNHPDIQTEVPSTDYPTETHCAKMDEVFDLYLAAGNTPEDQWANSPA